jgi:hypothetical protein
MIKKSANKIYSEQLIPYVMSLGEYSEGIANEIFCQLIEINIELGQFIKDIVESIPSKTLEFNIKTLIINFLKISIEKDIIGLIDIISKNYVLISYHNDRLLCIIMDFYIEIISDDDIVLINEYSNGCEFNVFEMIQSIRTHKKSHKYPLGNVLSRISKNISCSKKETGIDLHKIQQEYNICNICKKNAKFQCGKCNTTRYCSKECQLDDWPRHKKICTILEE